MKINLGTIENKQLVQTLDNLIAKESATTLEILTYLNELERRKLYLELGYSSLWSYMTLKLNYSEPGASRRLKAARCIREFPEVYEYLSSRALSLSALCIVSGILNIENKEHILPLVAGKSFKEVERIVASYKPKGEVKDTLKPISVEITLPAKTANLELSSVYPPKQEFVQSHSIESAPSKIVMEKVKFSFQASLEFSKKFEKTKSLLSGKFPMGATFEEVFDAALSTYLRAHDPEKRMERRARRKALRNFKHGKRIPSKPLRDLILVRDKRCSYVSPEGIRCNATWDLEVHHIKPWAKGGKTSEDNLKLLCRAHNMHQAEKDFGREFISKLSA